VSLGLDSVAGDKKTQAAAHLQKVIPPRVSSISVPHHRVNKDKAAITPATAPPARETAASSPSEVN